MATNHKRNIFIIIHSKKSDNINKIKDNDLLKKKNVVSGKKKIFDIIKDINKKDEKHVSSDLDTFLYIIDPRSTDMVFPALTVLPDLTKWLACLYNDNINGNTNTNSQIKKTFAADVPYLVIVSAYDPSLSTSTGSYYLSVLD